MSVSDRKDFYLYVKEHLSMIILAGGNSLRMGTDKADLIYRGQTFLNIQIEKGKQLGIRDIIVSGYRGTHCGERVVMDRVGGRGPLGGLETCLRQAAHEKCLVLSVDVPLISAAELQGLIRCNLEHKEQITILQHEGGQEPLIGIYSAELADVIEERLNCGWGSVFRFLEAQGYGIYQSEGEKSQYWNINEAKIYQSILKEDF